MADYFLTSEAIPATRKILIRRFLSIALLLLVVSFCYGHFVLHTDPRLEVPMALLLTGVMVVSYFQNFKREKLAISSYRLVVEPGCVSRFQSNLPPIRLTTDNIVRIVENTQGVLTIVSTDKYRAVYIPKQVTNRAELLQELTSLKPITTLTTKTFLEKIAPYTSVGVLGLIGVFYVVTNKIVSTISGTLLLGLLAWSAWHIWRNKDLPPQSRRLLWFLPLMWLSILAGMILRLL